MNTLDSQLMEDLQALPGWDALASMSTANPTERALADASYAVRSLIAADRDGGGATRLGRAGIPLSQPQRKLRSKWAISIVAAAAAAIAPILVPALKVGDTPPASAASASEFLTHLATTATALQGVTAEFWRVSQEVSTPSMDGSNGPSTRSTVWFGRHGGRWIAVGEEPVVKASETHSPFVIGERAALSWDQVETLPSDPAQLEARLQAILGSDSLAIGAGRLLAYAPLTAAQRAATFTVLARQPSATIREGVVDALGRTGTAILFPFGETSSLNMVFATDGTVLEISEVSLISQTIPPSAGNAHVTVTNVGDIVERATYVDVGGTNQLPVD